jgi:hypothetical protein
VVDLAAFTKIFRHWLEELYNVEPSPSKPNDPYWFKDEKSSHPNQTEHHITTDGSDARDLKGHEMLIKQIFEVQHRQTLQLFQQYSEINDEPSAVPTIHKTDFPLLLRNLLYNQNASLYEKDGNEDFFMRNNTFRNMESFVKKPEGDWTGEESYMRQTQNERLTFEDFQ